MKWMLLLPLFGCAYLLTGLLRRYALHRNLIDIPNARSSHEIPTPRGGGMAIVACVLLALPLIAWAGWIPWQVAWGLWGAGCMVALLGFLDDHGHIPARWRLVGHFIAAAWALWCFDGLPPLSITDALVVPAWLVCLVAAIWLVWQLNLYNFMDGIDGIAGVQAVTVGVSAATIYALDGHTFYAATPLVLAVASAGFLVWNFPPARIFMGDAGSGFLGMLFGTLTVHAAWLAPELVYSWLILLAVFVTDATLTLARRALRGARVYEAHRSHAYQVLGRRLGRHLPVTVGVAVINMLWLFPLAFAVAQEWLGGLTGLALAYFPLGIAAFVFKAGAPD